MPFFNIGGPSSGDFGITRDMPRPLNVAIMDKDQEREGRTTAALVDAFGYKDNEERLIIEVPKTFLTDFASIPHWARAVLSPFGRHAKAAVLHDWLYAIGEPGVREQADRIFRNAMDELDVEGWARELMYTAVKVGGEEAFERAAEDWPNTFVDVISGRTIQPLFDREQAFIGQPHGPKRF